MKKEERDDVRTNPDEYAVRSGITGRFCLFIPYLLVLPTKLLDITYYYLLCQ